MQNLVNNDRFPQGGEQPLLRYSERTKRYYDSLERKYFSPLLVPSQKMQILAPALLVGMVDQAKRVDEVLGLPIADLLEFYFAKGLDDNPDKDVEEAGNVSGLIPLSALFAIMIGTLEKDSFIKGLPLNLAFIEFFTNEKFHDDFGKMDWDGLYFEQSEIVGDFSEYIRGLMIDDNFDMDGALAEILRDERTIGIKTEISELIKKLEEKLPGIIKENILQAIENLKYNIKNNTILSQLIPDSILGNYLDLDIEDGRLKELINRVVRDFRNSFAPFFDNPNAYFLATNLVSAYVLDRSLKELKNNNQDKPAVVMMADKAIEFLFERYRAMDELVEDPAMPVTQAYKVGARTILTNTFHGMLAGAAVSDENVAKELEDPDTVRFLDETIDAFTFGIRGLNDTGLTSVNMDFTKSQIEYLREVFGVELTPRQLFTELGKVEHDNELGDYLIDLDRFEIDKDMASALNELKLTDLNTFATTLNNLLVNPEINTNISLMIDTLQMIDAKIQKLFEVPKKGKLRESIPYLIQHLMTIRLKLLQNYFSRHVKDSEEGEYNMSLNSGVTEDVLDPPEDLLYSEETEDSVEKIWDIFETNLEEIGRIFGHNIAILFLNIRQLSEKAPYIAEFIARKFLFNVELYVLFKGDYDRFGKWSQMMSMNLKTYRDSPKNESPSPIDALMYYILTFYTKGGQPMVEAELYNLLKQPDY